MPCSSRFVVRMLKQPSLSGQPLIGQPLVAALLELEVAERHVERDALGLQVLRRPRGSRAGTSTRSGASPFGVPSGSALENGVANAAPAAEPAPDLAEEHRAAGCRVGAQVPRGEHVARGLPGPHRRRGRRRRAGRAAAPPVRLRLEKNTRCSVPSVKPGRAEPVGAREPLLGHDRRQARARQVDVLVADHAREAGQPRVARSAARTSRSS